MKKTVTMYAHGSRESSLEVGTELGLTGDALQIFKYVIDEVELEVEVETETGVGTIITVNGRGLQS